MQDNSKHNYDPGLVDQGWSLLEKQLDEVLPQKRKRRFSWFWLLLLLGFSTLTGAGYYLVNTSSAAKTNYNEPVNSTISVPETETTASATMPVAINEKENQSVIETATEENLSVTTSSESQSLQPISFVKPSINVGTVENTTEIGPPAEDLIVISKEPVVEPVITYYQPAPVIPVNTSDNLSALPLPFSIVSSETLEEVPTLPQTVSRQVKNSNWRIYSEGQLTVALGKQAGLLGIAAGVERKLGKSWNLGFGLAYERSEQKLSASDISYSLSQAEADFVNASTGSTTYSITQAYQAVSYDRFKGELQAHYQLHPRWRIGGGLSLAYYRQALFDVNQADRFQGIEQGQGGGTPVGISTDERFNLFEDSVSVYEFDTSNNAAVGPYPLAPARWQLAGMFSVQYQVSSHWAVNMNYRRDLTEWQLANTDFGTPSFAQFGLRYYFK